MTEAAEKYQETLLNFQKQNYFRPFWKTNDFDAKTLQNKERESFLEWRRNLAK
jgi:hypothetical protein